MKNNKQANINMNPKPILRWAGGKSWLFKCIKSLIPDNYNNYHEPFLGGASIYFHLNPTRESFLSDINYELIETYLQLRDHYKEVLRILSEYKNSKEEYYRIRKLKPSTKPELAARLIFLNKTCFNGLYRVNRQGKFNVPYGCRTSKNFLDIDELYVSIQRLKSTHIWQADFEESLSNIQTGDLVYIDPPYTSSHNNNGFIRYNEKLFSMDDQIRLAKYIQEIHSRKAYYILSNAKTSVVKELFGDIAKPILVKRRNTIGGKGSIRGKIEEYVFTNSHILQKSSNLNDR